jgi:hypothetical protein
MIAARAEPEAAPARVLNGFKNLGSCSGSVVLMNESAESLSAVSQAIGVCR